MNRSIKSIFAFVMVLVLCVSFVPAVSVEVDAATVEYRYSGSYIYNWGTRETLATFLSPNAEAFYKKSGNKSYEELIKYSGGTGVNNAPDSDLYRELQNLMKNNHKTQTSYQGTRDLYRYTDCQGSGYTDNGKISCFYTGKLVGPAWDGGATWNREHTWPNSKGDGGNDENDIMMLRPADASTNSSRGNKAYGKSSGYYNPNGESNGKYDLRGDVSRIFLYTYVRWGITDGGEDSKFTTWGSTGVMESLDVLLEWMEADPVDTWELGRNDSVQAITGTRNVFVDYPELAFLLFGEEIPADMDTPSGKAKEGTTVECAHSYDNQCDTNCNKCGEVRTVGAHNYSGWQTIEPATTEKAGKEKGYCTYCGAQTEREIPKLVGCNHIYDNDCDPSCNLCGKKREVGNHSFSTYCDNSCNKCGAIVGEANHLYTGWQTIEEATTEKAGTEKGHCIYCGGETEREIPKLTPPTEEPPVDEPSNPPTENPPADEPPVDEPPVEEPQNYTGVIVGASVGGVSVIGLAVFFFIKRRKII